MRYSNRSGFSMIELVWVFTLITMLLGVCVSWIHQSTKFSRRIGEHKSNHDTMTRLAWDFRDDVRSCDSIALDDKKKLTLNWKNGDLATYVIDGTTVLFEKKDQNSESVKREAYSVSDNLLISWDDGKMPELIGLVVSRTLDAKPSNRNGDSSPVASSKNQPVKLPIELEVRVSPNRWAQSTDKEGEQ